MILALILLLQALTADEISLFNRITEETATPAKLKLLLEFERRFPKSSKIGEIYEQTMEAYRAQGQAGIPSMITYGEKAISFNAENLQALTIVARQYAVQGTKLDKALDYAKRAKVAIDKKRTGKPPAGVTPAEWQEYLQQMKVSADWTLNYVQSINTSVLRRRGR